MEQIGKLLIIVGISIVGIGILLLIANKLPILNQLGNLPGDIHIQRGSLTCLFPITSMILLSIILSIVLNIILRIINRL